MNDAEHDSVETQSRWPWFAAGFLLFASAASTAVSVHLHWIPCWGNMLDGTVIAPKATGEITATCLTRMENGLPFPYVPGVTEQAPWVSEMGETAMVLAVASWIVLVLGLRLRRRTRWIALIAAVAPMLLLVMGWFASFGPQDELNFSVFGWLWVGVEFVAYTVMLALFWQGSELSGATFFGLAIVLWGVTAFGWAHTLAEYIIMEMFNQSVGGTPPGTGWITVAVLVIAGSASFMLGGRRLASPTVAYSVSPHA